MLFRCSPLKSLSSSYGLLCKHCFRYVCVTRVLDLLPMPLICSLSSHRNHACVSSSYEVLLFRSQTNCATLKIWKTLRNSEIFNVLGKISLSIWSFKFGSSFDYNLCIKVCVTPVWSSKDVCARNENKIPTTPLFVKLQSLIKTLTPFSFLQLFRQQN